MSLNYKFYQQGSWGQATSALAAFLGPGAVALFFMITAFLFWNRAIDSSGHLDAYKFYVSRLRRITPMYLVAATLLIVTVFALTGFRLEVTLPDVARQIAAWLLFTIPGWPDINNFHQTLLINTVFWSLVWEWGFYILLPFIAVFAHGKQRWYWIGAAALYIWFFSERNFEWYFLAGCAAAMLTRFPVIQRLAMSRAAAIIALGCIAVAIMYGRRWSLSEAVMLFIPFTIFAGGNTVFGLLCCRPARLLGLLSYSVYLLHNWILFVIWRITNQYISVSSLSEAWYWSIGGLIALVTVACASITYRFIEMPYLKSPRQTLTQVSTARMSESSISGK
jgi:peptidoglycan/LPS O-acetylase OafA/YrhL